MHHLMEYFENDSQIRDILITGGDALMSQNKSLEKILFAVCDMAERKRKANRERPDGQKYAEMQRIRLGTRLPVYLPMRINDELVEILRRTKEKGTDAGISQFIIQTHFQSPLELTPMVLEGIRKLKSAGWSISNPLIGVLIDIQTDASALVSLLNLRRAVLDVQVADDGWLAAFA